MQHSPSTGRQVGWYRISRSMSIIRYVDPRDGSVSVDPRWWIGAFGSVAPIDVHRSVSIDQRHRIGAIDPSRDVGRSMPSDRSNQRPLERESRCADVQRAAAVAAVPLPIWLARDLTVLSDAMIVFGGALPRGRRASRGGRSLAIPRSSTACATHECTAHDARTCHMRRESGTGLAVARPAHCLLDRPDLYELPADPLQSIDGIA